MNPRTQISPATRFLTLDRPFVLESGERLENVTIAYRTWGRLAPARDNAVVVCHALTGSADVDAWWAGIFGPGRALDPERDFIVCANALGSCYGTCGPLTERRPGVAWGPDFPRVTVRDQVRLQQELVARLGIERIALVIGGSLGGMQALEWGVLGAGYVDAVAAISAPAAHDAWALGLSALARRALTLDPRFRGGHYPPDAPPVEGLELARQIAMLSYRSAPGLGARFGRERAPDGRWAITSWLDHHGERLVARFDANCYLALLDAMDTHDLGRERGGLATVLARYAPALHLLVVTSDVLYPPADGIEIARRVPGAELAIIDAPHGHDTFLIEQAEVDRRVRAFRAAAAAEALPLVAGGVR
ncbi:MAG: homoserine O-acetyltransferase [Acidobacteria bacterium]|jgi:homoserine O-acetyltransferase|nr:homoserine O-acetyltransferase [Thermoanaerobaculia bacterium]NLN12575.1 homoserine O-acetyltransferase [Acidobacteriota bacterium]OQC42527.1 MAG: Homoserine O-acetyltransferase [Acidobacteria bacterium ADurb.Bin051]MBP7814431.1 homoserine O-acetyltransferase [Thermoanaerobaculia bacterium]MBP8844238.1 homoserine O-acetyltransferase [Thermoanaerobaculia bacterium]